jgi:hypothetical protein
MHQIWRKRQDARKRFESLPARTRIFKGVKALLLGLGIFLAAYFIKDIDLGDTRRFGSNTAALQFFGAILGVVCLGVALHRFMSAAPHRVRRKLRFERLGRMIDEEGRGSDLMHVVLVFVILVAVIAALGTINDWF